MPSLLTESVQVLHNDYTENLGKINGTFIIHSNIGNPSEYFLHIFNDEDIDSLPDDPSGEASIPVQYMLKYLRCNY